MDGEDGPTGTGTGTETEGDDERERERGDGAPADGDGLLDGDADADAGGDADADADADAGGDADAEAEFVPVDDFDRLADRLRAWCDGPVEVGADRIRCAAGAARFAVTRDGRVEAGMPLHDLAREGVERVGFDPDGRTLVLSGPGFRYRFRHP
jgi:hypothetical protein